MKWIFKKYLLPIFFCGVFLNTVAQSSVNYTASMSTTGSLIADFNANTINTTGATNLLNNGVSNSTSAMQTIGFDFFFMGKYYSHFTAGSNGTIALGINTSAANIITPTLSNDLTRTVAYPPGANTAPVLAPFWDKMVTAFSGATIRKVITGVAPNRCCVIEWNTAINNILYTGAPSALFQARLYETTGTIEYVYGPMAIVASPTFVTASIGFTSGTTDNQFIAVQNLSTYTFTTTASAEPATQSLVSSSTVGTIAGLNSTVEDSRRQFRFSPTALIGTNLSALNITAVGATTATLNWTDTYTNESNYTVLVSTDNINFTNKATLPANSTKYQVTGLTNNTLYYFKVIAHNEGATSNAATETATTFCSMNGTYSIGTGGDFDALYVATENLKLRGVSGNVFFEFNTTYNPVNELYAVKFPKLNQIPCATNSFGLTVRPAANASNITISNFTDSAIFYLDSCTYITIDGRPGGIGNTSKLTLTNTRNAPSITLINSSRNNFRYLNLSGGPIPSSGLNGVIALRGTLASGCDNNLFENCSIYSIANQAPRSILLLSLVTGNIVNNNNIVRQCNFWDFNQQAIQLQNGNDGWLIEQNSFYQTRSFYQHPAAGIIKVDYSSNAVFPVTIINNYFGGTAPLCSGDVMPFKYGTSAQLINVQGNALINNNQFSRIKFYNDSAANNPNISLIYVDNNSNGLNYQINSNKIGSTNLADSISILQTFNGYQAKVALIFGTGGMGEIEMINNRIQNIQCRGKFVDATVEWVGIQMTSTSIKINNNFIGNNIFNHTNATTAAIRALGNNGTRINKNTIQQITCTSDGALAYQYGIYANMGTVDSISGNTISQLKHNMHNGAIGNALYGILTNSLSPGGLSNTIDHNHIYNLQNGITAGSMVAGIQCGSDTYISNNFIHHLNVGTNINTTVYGIHIPDKYSRLDNNMVQLGLDSLGNSITAGNIGFIGISGGHVMTHNSVYIGGQNVADGFSGSIAYAFLGNALPAIYYNNIFVNERSNADVSFTAKHQIIIVDVSGGGDYNAFYGSGNGVIMGTYQGIRYTTFNDWKTATGLEGNSLFANPNFVTPNGSASTVNLHVQYGSPIEAAGTNTNTTARDYDDQNRNSLSPVDIGADAGNFSVCPVADAGPDYVVYAGTKLRLGNPTPNNNVNHLWFVPSIGFTSTEPNPIVTIPSTVNIIYTITSGACESRDTSYITTLAAPSTIACSGGNISIFALVLGSTYQWQVDTGNGFINIANNAMYSGAQTNILNVQQVPSSYYGYAYRCISDDLTSTAQILTFENRWTGTIDNSWHNPGNWSCGVIPDGGTDVYITSGTVVLGANGICRTLYIGPDAIFTIGNGFNLTLTH